MKPSTAELCQLFDEFMYEIQKDLERGEYKSAAKVIDDVPDEHLRAFTYYACQLVRSQLEMIQHQVEEKAKLQNSGTFRVSYN
jgi:hypothetical protein